MPLELIIPIVLALLVILTIYQGLCIVQQSQTVIIEQSREVLPHLGSGVNIIIPLHRSSPPHALALHHAWA